MTTGDDTMAERSATAAGDAASQDALLARARGGDEAAFRALVEPHQRELQVHCYRMLGSLQDAEDVTQEALVRAWRHLGTFEQRASLRAWLYRIATNACLTALARRPPARLVQDEVEPTSPTRAMADGVEVVDAVDEPARRVSWIDPYPDVLLDIEDAVPGPEARYTQREAVRFAFMAAIHYLPPRQRAILLLRDVLEWSAREVADLLGTTSVAVNSGLQRARATMAERLPRGSEQAARAARAVDRQLLDRLVAAFEHADVGLLAQLLADDATLAMPPFSLWFRGRDAVTAYIGGVAWPGLGRLRVRETGANGQPALAIYEEQPDGAWTALGLMVLTLADGEVTEINAWPDPSLFPAFRLPLTLGGGTS